METQTITEVSVPTRATDRFVEDYTPTQRAAFELFDIGFNIGPTKPASKEPFKWGLLIGSRVHRSFIPELFDNRAGIFVLTGRLSMNLTILDCETTKAAAFHAREFERRGLPVWRVQTARGRHFWWLSKDGEVANIKDSSGEWEVRGNLRYCLCPPSIHPSGVIYEWEYRDGMRPPAFSMAELDWLPLKPALKARREFEPQDTDPLANLSRATRDFLANGASLGTRNFRLFNAACDLAGNGMSQGEARGILEPAARLAGLEAKEFSATVRSAFSQQRTPARPNTHTPRQAPTWSRALAYAEAHQWAALSCNVYGKRYSVSASTARGVFLACVERARRDGGEVFRATTREVAELARTHSETAHAGLVCLAESGYLRRCETNKQGAALFAFPRKLLRQPHNTHTGSDGSVRILQQSRSDVWERGGLGRSGERVWRYLLTKTERPAEVARALGINRSTVARALTLLIQHGLVERVGRCWAGVSAATSDLEQIAAACGVAGRGAKRTARHGNERALYVSRMLLRAKRYAERKRVSRV